MTASSETVLATDEWVQRYLRLLGVEREPPSSDLLARLACAHLKTVPFENVSSLLRARAHRGSATPPLDPEAVIASWEQGRAGGICFEVAEMLSRLLVALGFRAWPVLGQASFPGSHQAVLVEAGGGRYLVDAANGAPFFEPIPLGGTTEVHRAGLSYRFHAGNAPETCVQDRWIEHTWHRFCRYDLRPPEPAARDAAYQRHHTPGQSWVVGAIRLVRCEEDAVYALRNGELSRYTSAGKQTERVTGPAAYRRFAVEVLRLPLLPVEDGLATLAELGGPIRR